MTSFTWSDAEVRAALGLGIDATLGDLVFRGISTDSRAVGEGDLFVALTGEHFDGHDYVAEAVRRGAAGAVVRRDVELGDAPIYPVGDTLAALGRLARHRRRSLPARVVGITGSVGKTTTKDLTRGALGDALRVHATRGNFNNQVGVPRTLLDAPPDADVVVVEMGTNEPGEIGLLTAIAEPEVGVVTTVGETHLEKLGSLEGVLEEKLDLLRGLPSDGHAVVGDEPPQLPEAARDAFSGVLVTGLSERADPGLRPTAIESDDSGRARFLWNGRPVALQVPGRHAVANAVLALAVADILGIGPDDAARGVSSVVPAAMRGEIREIGGLTLLVDCYNANPQSVRAALDLLTELPAYAGHVAVLGSMLELGTRSDSLHDDVLSDALNRGFALIVATGEFAAAAERSSEAAEAVGAGRLAISAPVAGAFDAMAGRLRAGVAVLLKGSRGVRLERLLDPIERAFGAGAPPQGGAA